VSEPQYKAEKELNDYSHLVFLCEQGMLYEAEEWLRAGHRATMPERAKKCVLEIAVRKGFHSLVRLLLRHDCSEKQKLGALKHAADHGNMALCKLLVEAGAPVGELAYWHLDRVIDRDLIDYMLDHGLNLSRDDGLAQMLVDRRAKPLLGVLLGHRERFTEWEEQAAKALCTFVEKKDLKWVCMMIWAKADPWMRVHELDPPDWRADDDEMKQSAVERAVEEGNLEIYKALRVSPTPEQATELLASTWLGPSREMITALLEAGADLNAPNPESGSLLHRLLHSFAWHCSTGYGRRDPKEEVEMVAWLIRKGARWQPPAESGSIDSIRRDLYRAKGELAVEVIRLMEAGQACEPELLRELANKPKMRTWIRLYDERLYGRLFPEAGPRRRLHL
jgi:hypothetical protein